MIQSSAARSPHSLAARLLALVTLLPQRLHERPFWIVQALVVAVTAIHVILETGALWHREIGIYLGIHHIPVALYIIPIAYASLSYGIEGGVFTGLWCALLTVPNTVLWHRASYSWLGEISYTSFVVGLGILMALPVERERRQRRRAEATSRRLALLNEVATALAQTSDLAATLEPVLARVVDVMGLQAACVALRDDEAEGPTLLACRAIRWEDRKALERAICPEDHPRPAEGLAAPLDGVLAVPLVTDGPFSGILAALVGDARPVTSEDQEILAAVGSQLGVAIDNARLHRQEKERLESYVQQVTRAQEEERKRVARELHDAGAQALVLLCRGLDDLAEITPLPETALTRLEELRGLGERTLESLRRFSRDLRPAVLDDLGLVPALEWLTSDLTQRTGIRAALRVSGTPRRLPAEAEVALFRIAQEVLRNAERHSGASRVTVSAAFESGGFRLLIGDDGRGFSVPPRDALAAGGTLGLLGMQERAQLVGAALSIWSQPGRGTRVTIELAG